MAHLSKYIKDRKLEDRGYLEFFFERKQRKTKLYSKEDTGTNIKITSKTYKQNFTKVKIPFFENPTITESKASRLGKYKVIGRNSDLYSFLGADSRSLNLSFYMTLPNLYEYAQLGLTVYKRTGFLSKQRDRSAERERFASMADLFPPSDRLDDSGFKKVIKTIESYEQSYINSVTTAVDFGSLFETFSNLLQDIGLASTEEQKAEQKLAKTRVKALYYFWINVVRTATMGSSDGSQGPPIIKLSFGPLYQRVPFIATKYDISFDEMAGYDLETMLPRRVRINLALEEFRVGNFGKYSPIMDDSDGYVEIDTSENVAGWDSILKYGSADPRQVPYNNTGPDVNTTELGVGLSRIARRFI